MGTNSPEAGSECRTGSATDEKAASRAKNAAYRLLAYRSRSRNELIEKLSARGFDDVVIAGVVSDLERYGYINDRKFAEEWAAHRVRLSGLGRRRIEQELRERGIDRALVGETLGLFSREDEEVSARKAAEKKLRLLVRAEPAARRRRLAGYLERKGFSAEIIAAVMKTISSASSTNDPEEANSTVGFL